MIVLQVRNVNDAYARGMTLLNARGSEHESRNGPVLKLNTPVTTVYRHPVERVLFDATRDANPFFHLFEALWMLAGRNDLRTITHLLPSFAQFSDDGETLHGAYGYRWRNAGSGEDIDQLSTAIQLLASNPLDRRVVIQMWDAEKDLAVDSKDIPCNDTIKLQVSDGKLDMIVFCRSNDIVFGAYGANAVHMSVLHEYIATMSGLPVGCYSQISCDYHAYLATPYRFPLYFPVGNDKENPYERGGLEIVPLVSNPETFDNELMLFTQYVAAWAEINSHVASEFHNAFFARVAWPMYQAIRRHKNGQTADAVALLSSGHTRIDWLSAGTEWLRRRLDRRPPT